MPKANQGRNEQSKEGMRVGPGVPGNLPALEAAALRSLTRPRSLMGLVRVSTYLGD